LSARAMGCTQQMWRLAGQRRTAAGAQVRGLTAMGSVTSKPQLTAAACLGNNKQRLYGS
jgi:hypothetical protein